MSTMSLAGLNLPFGRELTADDLDRIPWRGARFELVDGVLVVSDGNIGVDDLDDLPDDGHRYELLDGVLVVSPAPSVLHQRVCANLYVALRASAPSDVEVFFAPTDVRLPGRRSRVQPDLVVATDVDVSAQSLTSAPVLAVEVLSRGTRRFDEGTKKDVLRSARCPHYWIVDPRAPSIRAWRLVGSEYVDAGSAHGSAALALDAPFPITVVPQALTERSG